MKEIKWKNFNLHCDNDTQCTMFNVHNAESNKSKWNKIAYESKWSTEISESYYFYQPLLIVLIYLEFETYQPNII